MLAGRAHLLVGIGGSSKTRLLYHLAVAGIVGRLPWGWEIEQTGASVLILAEDTAEDVHRTLAALMEHGDFTDEERLLIGRRLKVYPMAGQGARLLAIFPGGVLLETGNAAGLIETCRDIDGLVFIGLDPALALTEGDEMNPAHQRRLGEFADRLAIETGACVVLATHAAKAIQGADELGSHSSRGSGAITDAVRGEFTLRTMTANEAMKYGVARIEERKAIVQLVATKGNYLRPDAFAPVWLTRGAGGVLSLAELDPTVPAAVRVEDLQALELLRNLALHKAPTKAEWQGACVQAGLVRSKSSEGARKALGRIYGRLFAAGLVEPGSGKGVVLPAAVEANE